MPTAAEPWLVDTSAAVAMLVADHEQHEQTFAALSGRQLGLCGHAAFESYSVLTRLPGVQRLSPPVARRLLTANFPQTRHLGAEAARALLAASASTGSPAGRCMTPSSLLQLWSTAWCWSAGTAGQRRPTSGWACASSCSSEPGRSKLAQTRLRAAVAGDLHCSPDRTRSSSAVEQAGRALGVRDDRAQAGHAAEGAVGRDEGIGRAVAGNGGEHGIEGAQVVGVAEQLGAGAQVLLVHYQQRRQQVGERGGERGGGGTGVPASPHLHELLQDLHRGGSGDGPRAGRFDQRTAVSAQRVLGSRRVHEHGGVEDDHSRRPGARRRRRPGRRAAAAPTTAPR